MTISGRCLCGAVQVSISAAPLAARVCWCRLCQYLGSGNGTVSVCFPAISVSVLGDVRWYQNVADSGNRMLRGFCPRCGTPMFSKADVRPHIIFVRMGVLDDPNLLGPQMTIWTDAAPNWAIFDPALPIIPGQPPPVA